VVIETAAGQFQDGTNRLDRVVRQQPHGKLPFLERTPASSPEAFFAISNSIVSRPTNRSNSAIRSCCALRTASFSKARVAPARNCCRQLPTICAVS
jgi:hypothetical protein